jgi:hypothetical protein
MRDWINSLLDSETPASTAAQSRELMASTDEFTRLLDGPDGLELITAIYFEDIEPLRAKYPHLSGFLHFPPDSKRRRGQRKPFRPKYKSDVLLYLAVEDVRRIKLLWKQHYNKTRRLAKHGKSAIELASDRWHEKGCGLSRTKFEEAIQMRLKTRPK